MFQLRRTARETDAFEDDFWKGGDLERALPGAAGQARIGGGLERIFRRASANSRSTGKQGSPSDVTLDGARRAMRAAYQREIDALEAHLAVLATVGSVSPYVGLFGTVWGIMNAFRGLANVQQATLAKVAPGIAEALIATAIGLFAAIPAVVAYNRFTHDVDRLAVRFETFMEEFSNILQRQADVDDRAPPMTDPCLIANAPPQIDQPDQRRAVHRRDAGAARHLHGHRAADRTGRDRPAVGRQQAHRSASIR